MTFLTEKDKAVGQRCEERANCTPQKGRVLGLFWAPNGRRADLGRRAGRPVRKSGVRTEGRWYPHADNMHLVRERCVYILEKLDSRSLINLDINRSAMSFGNKKKKNFGDLSVQHCHNLRNVSPLWKPEI